MFLEPISSSEINNPLVKIINQLVSEFNIHSPVTSQSEFRPSSEINPDTEFIMVTPIINNIPILRLEAIPFARLTVECQAQWEKEKGQNARFRPRVALGFAGGQNDVDLSVSLDDDEE